MVEKNQRAFKRMESPAVYVMIHILAKGTLGATEGVWEERETTPGGGKMLMAS